MTPPPMQPITNSLHDISVPSSFSTYVSNGSGSSLVPNSSISINAPTPKRPDAATNTYILALLKHCHAKVTSCYGCKGKFNVTGYPSTPLDLVLQSKMKKYFDKSVMQQIQSSYPTCIFI